MPKKSVEQTKIEIARRLRSRRDSLESIAELMGESIETVREWVDELLWRGMRLSLNNSTGAAGVSRDGNAFECCIGVKASKLARNDRGKRVRIGYVDTFSDAEQASALAHYMLGRIDAEPLVSASIRELVTKRLAQHGLI